MNFHPFNQCWRWSKASDLRLWLGDKLAVVDDWITQRSTPYYRMRVARDPRALKRRCAR